MSIIDVEDIEIMNLESPCGPLTVSVNVPNRTASLRRKKMRVEIIYQTEQLEQEVSVIEVISDNLAVNNLLFKN